MLHIQIMFTTILSGPPLFEKPLSILRVANITRNVGRPPVGCLQLLREFKVKEGLRALALLLERDFSTHHFGHICIFSPEGHISGYHFLLEFLVVFVHLHILDCFVHGVFFFISIWHIVVQ